MNSFIKKITARNVESERGVVLIGAILTLLAIAIFLPALWYVTNNESKWSVKQKKTTIAFHLAEQGMDRGVWKLQEADAIYNIVSTGGVIAGYNFDVIYQSTGVDSSDGEYKIKLTTSSSGRVLVQSIGRDFSTDEVRSLEAEYTKAPEDAGMRVRGALRYKSGLKVHWGPVITYTSIDESPNEDWPRKISKGQIVGRDTDPSPPNGDDGTWPNPGVYDYASYQDLGEAPKIDLDAYRELAKSSRIPPLRKSGGSGSPCSAGRTATADPPGSGYFPTDQVELATPCDGSYIFRNSTSVIFIESTSSLGTRSGDAVQLQLRAFLTMGDLDLNGDSDDPSFSAKMPPDSREEYYYGNGVTKWTSENFDDACPVQPCTGYYTIPQVHLIGYIYVGDNLPNSSGSNINYVGVLDAARASNPNNITVYYDQTLSTGILTTSQTPRQLYWRESKLAW